VGAQRRDPGAGRPVQPGLQDRYLRPQREHRPHPVARRIWFVHRTAGSQLLAPNSSLRVSRSRDGGRSFHLQAVIPAQPDRDIRDPHFYVVGQRLYIKAITRLPGFAVRDMDAGTTSVDMHSRDGRRWTRPHPMGPVRWGFWRSCARRAPTTRPPTRTATCASGCTARPMARPGGGGPRADRIGGPLTRGHRHRRSRKARRLRAFPSAGGGTRTPDTRIRWPDLQGFGSRTCESVSLSVAESGVLPSRAHGLAHGSVSLATSRTPYP
jgi:hypothetical protein